MRNRVRILSLLLAGGMGSRLGPLTWYRTKPAVPFGGQYRIVDFALSNFINSGLHSIYVLTQFKSQELHEHIANAWSMGNLIPGNFITSVPAQMQTAGRTWYKGTADAIYQNIPLIRDHDPEQIVVFGSDHIYKMDIEQMWEAHMNKKADATVACLPTPISEASRFGVIEVDDNMRIIGFDEKPANPKPIPGRPEMALVSMGNYIFDRKFLENALIEDAADETSSHDFGRNILPRAVADHQLYAYDFRTNTIPGQEGENTYWRDIGTVESYWSASLDLRSATPEFNLYNPEWPVYTAHEAAPPVKFVHNEDGRRGRAVDSIVCGGSIISGARVIDSVLARFVRLNSFSEVSESILFNRVTVGRGAKLKLCIVDEGVVIEDKDEIGFDHDRDRSRGFFVSDDGIVVIGRRPYGVDDPWRSV